jgi:ABC-type spermidine/putrescine transport system permease subunit I
MTKIVLCIIKAGYGRLTTTPEWTEERTLNISLHGLQRVYTHTYMHIYIHTLLMSLALMFISCIHKSDVANLIKKHEHDSVQREMFLLVSSIHLS